MSSCFDALRHFIGTIDLATLDNRLAQVLSQFFNFLQTGHPQCSLVTLDRLIDSS